MKRLHGRDTTVDDARVARRIIGGVRGYDQDGRSLTGLNLGAVGGIERESDDIANSVAVSSDRENRTGRERTNGVTTGGGPGGPGPAIVKVDVRFASDRVAAWLSATATVRGGRVEHHLIVEIKCSGTGFLVNRRDQRAAIEPRAGSERLRGRSEQD